MVGASERAGSAGRVVWDNLASFPGRRIPVSSRLTELDGITAYAELGEVPDHVDLAVVVVPAPQVPGVVDDAVRAGVGACVVLSAGFAETGPDGRDLQERIVDRAREGGLVLAGPNCLGVQNWTIGLNASMAGGSAEPGGIAVITQSGSYAMALHAMSADDRASFSLAYSTGNRADLDDAEVLDFLRQHSPTSVVAALVESIVDGPALLDAAARLTAAGKPFVIAPLGRSEGGSRAAASHTAALARDRRVWNDVLTEAGAIVVSSGVEMLDAARVLHDQPPAHGPRVGVVTNSGGTGTELADLLADEGLVVPELSTALRQRLAEALPPYASSANPVDITPVWSRFTELYALAVEELARSGEVDVIVPVLLHRSADAAVGAALVDTLDRLRAEGVNVPVVVCWVATRAAWAQGDALRRAGVPVLEGPQRTARAVGHLRRAGAGAGPAPVAHRLGPAQDHQVWLSPALVGSDPARLFAWLAEGGVPMSAAVFADSPEEAVRAAVQIGFPVVAKVAHPDLAHKSEVGGVRVGLADEGAVRGAAEELLTLADGARIVVQPQLSGVELLVGAFRDPTFGPTVAVGVGGVLVELVGDIGFARAPVSREAAQRLLGRGSWGTLLAGFRGQPQADIDALVDLVVTVGDLIARTPQLEALDLNPVLATPGGCVAVDAHATWSAQR